MSNNIKVKPESNIGATLLLLLFLGLKLGHVITWSWWWVLAPLWAPVALVMVALLIIAIGVSLRK